MMYLWNSSPTFALIVHIAYGLPGSVVLAN